MMFSLVRIFSGQVFAPADKPATAYIRASSTINRCCIIGAVVCSAALVSVLPGQQERQFVVTGVGINPRHLMTREITACHFPF
jgi:hypothetical protein